MDNKAKDYFDKNFDNRKTYQRFGKIIYRPAGLDETVLTIVDGRVETINKAEFGDVIVRNMELGSSSEQYIIGDKEKFLSRYDPVGESINIDNHQCGFAKSTGLTEAVEYKGERIEFVAPWGEMMECLDGDYLCILPGEDTDQTYRIEKEAFSQTYKEQV